MARHLGTLIIAASIAVGASVAQAQQPTTPAGAAPTRIDCPAQGASAGSTGAVGTPQGAGQGSGLTAMPGKGEQRVDGEIKAISSTRTNRVVEVGNVKLEVEPATAVLVDCKPVTVADLKSGLKIKALYEVKDNNRYVAKVIEAER
jgi:hypothetical protein